MAAVVGAMSRRTVDARGEVARGDVVDLQRARIVAAMVEVVAERGVASATVARVVARSGVSRRTFYELFRDREDCFLAAFDLAIERGAARVLPAYRGCDGWPGRVRAGLRALLEFLDDEPGFAHLAVVDALGAGQIALARRRHMVGALVDAVDEGRRNPRAPAGLSRLTAEGVVGAVLAVMHARLSEPSPTHGNGRAGPMLGLLAPLMGMIVLPYRGRAAAVREAARPAPQPAPVVRPPAGALLGLEMRLTYRTVRVLAAIAALGGRKPPPNNREVAEAAGVADQGQISKLLARLEHLGLVANVGKGHVRGEPNAWQLTPKGQEVQHSISHEAEHRIL